MLRFLRDEMEFYFVESGKIALEFMVAEHADGIVSDMRMPGMGGATLLGIVQQKFPHVIRIMLTGQADAEAIMGTVGVVHQFLALKPDSNCEPPSLNNFNYFERAGISDRFDYWTELCREMNLKIAQCSKSLAVQRESETTNDN